MPELIAIYDACVLYPAPLRDLLVRLARTGLFRARWTDAIHDEWIRNLLENRPDLSATQLERTRQLMNAAVRDCLVVGYEGRIDNLTLPDPDDRHVLAAALEAQAQVIVTYNLRDFPAGALQPHGLEAQHPDEFKLFGNRCKTPQGGVDKEVRGLISANFRFAGELSDDAKLREVYL